jgi:hypothetical protein
MKINAPETRLNIREKYGSVQEFARQCGFKDRRPLDMILTQKRGISDRASNARIIIKRMRTEGLLVEEEDCEGGCSHAATVAERTH